MTEATQPMAIFGDYPIMAPVSQRNKLHKGSQLWESRLTGSKMATDFIQKLVDMFSLHLLYSMIEPTLAPSMINILCRASRPMTVFWIPFNLGLNLLPM